MANLYKQMEESITKHLRHAKVPQFIYSLNISLQYKYVYIETPKVACSTIKTTLQRLELDEPSFTRKDFEDLHKRDFSPLLNVKQIPDINAFVQRKDIFKFCFVRNPYDRVLSAYLDKIAGNTQHKKEILLELGRNENALDTKVSFSQFINVLSKQTIVNMNTHWKPQYYQTFQDYIEYDFIGKFENISEDFEKVGTNISPDFHKYYTTEKRHSTNANTKINEYYTDDLKKRVYAIYEKDFEYFGYEE